MIIGVGFDLASVQFWAEALDDPTTSVIEGTFTAEERAHAVSGPVPPAERFASRFAAKEAFTKAITSGRHDMPPILPKIDPKDIEVCKDAWGRPRLVLHGGADRLAQEFGVTQIWLSLTHENDVAGAMVILEGEIPHP